MTANTATRRLLTFAVTFTGGRTRDVEIADPDSRIARRRVWEGLTDEERDAVEDIECIDDRMAA